MSFASERAIAFVRNIASGCKSCMRMSQAHCRECPGRDAVEIVKAIDAEPSMTPVLSVKPYEYANRIVEQIRKAGCPLRSSEIDSMGRSPQYKHKMLVSMVRMGRLKAIPHGNGWFNLYEITTRTQGDGIEHAGQ